MNIRYLLGIIAVLGIAFLGVFLVSPSIGVVQADEFVLLDGYSGEFADSSAVRSFTYYHVEIPEKGNDVIVDVPDSFIAIDGYFYHTRNGVVTYAAPLGADDQWANRKLIHLDKDGSKYEFLVAYLEDGRVDFSKSILAIVPDEYFVGRPVTIDVPYAEPIDLSKLKELKPDEDLTNIPEPKSPSTGYASEVCFYPGLAGLPQTGLCEYLTISTHSTLGEVDSQDILKIKDLLARTFEGFKDTVPVKDFVDPRYGTPDDGDFNPTIEYDPQNVIEEIDGKVVEKKAAESDSGIVVEQDVSDSDVKNSEESPIAIQIEQSQGTPVFFSSLPTKKAELFSRTPPISLQSSTTLFDENFEGAFPSGNWSVSDVDSGNGSDYWDDTSLDSHFGSWSAWAADIGSHWFAVSSDSFGSSIFGWTAIDQNPNSGTDTWGYSSYRYSSSPGSAYSAGNSSTGASHLYDNDMTALMTKNTVYNASTWGANNVRIRFWTWYATASANDYFSVIFSGNGGSNYTVSCTYSGSSSGWQEKTCVVPSQFLTSQFKFGFLFQSDTSGVLEGAYVDDVYLERNGPNSDAGEYDDYQESRMQYGPVSVSGYTSTMLDFWVKGNVESCCDGFRVQLSADNSNWSTIDSFSANYVGWQQKQYPFNSLTGNIYFRLVFDSDDSVHNFPGYYVDDVKVWGYALLPDGALCSSAGECQSNVCGGAHVDYRIHCNTDGSPTAYGDQRVFVNTCGGAGTYDHTNYDYTSGSCASQKVCDADLSYYNSTFTTSQICKTNISYTCSTNPDCWNDNGGVDCKGSTAKICTYGNNGDYCTENVQCNSNLCISNQCSAGVPDGGVCTSDVMCQSKYCVADTSSQSHCQSSLSYSPLTYSFDTWDAAASNNHSTGSDQVAFTGTSVRPVTYDLRESTDMLCYDFDGDNTYDACYYDPNGCSGSCSSTSCNNYSIPNTVPSSKKFSCDVDSYFGCQIGADAPDQICSSGSCSVSTSFIKNKNPRVAAFYDCDNSDGLQSQHTLSDGGTDEYWVVNPKYYYCASQSSPGNQYYILGDYGSAYNDAITIQGPLSCGSGTSCSILADEQYVNTPAGPIPSACKTNPGGSCSQNSDCLYNKCQGNTCSNGFIYEGFLEDELTNPLANYTIKQYTCSNSLVQTIQTDSDGKFVFASGTGSYIIKLVAPWGEMEFGFSGGSCHDFGQGFIAGTTWVYNTHTTVHGQTITPQGNPEVGLPWELSTCQDVTLTSTNTNSNGDFQLYTSSGKQKIKVSLNGTKFAMEDTSGNSCFLNYGDVGLGQMEVTANCSLYNNTCYTEDSRLFNCSFDSQQGCVCSIQYCSAGCTDGAPQCNAVGTGTIHVIVKDNEKPIKNAPVWLNGASKGQTNGKGKLDINEEHGPYTVKASCPDSTLPTTKPIYLNGNHQYVTFNLDCGDPPKGKLTISSWTIDNYPAANVQVLVDDEVVGLTNGFGVIRMDEVEFGSHPVIIRYLLEKDGANVAYQQTKLADINQSSNNLDFIIYPAGQMGQGVTEINPSDAGIFLIPTLIAIGAVAWGAIDAYSTASDIAAFCSCALGQDAPPNEFQSCLDNLSSCDESMQGASCKSASKKYGTVNECGDDALMIALDTGLVGIPLGVGQRTLAKLPAIADDLKVVDKIVNFGGKIVKKGGDYIEYIGSAGKKLRAEITDAFSKFMKTGPNVGISLKTLGPDGVVGADAYLTKLDSISTIVDSSVVAKNLNTHFGKPTMTKVYEAVGQAINKPTYDPSKIRWVDELGDRTKTFDPSDFDKIGTAKGVINEIRVAKAEGFIDELDVAAFKVSSGSFNAEYDAIANSIARETKSPNSLVLDTGQQNPTLIQVINVINKKVNNMNAGKAFLPPEANFNQIYFYIAKEQNETVPAIVSQALEQVRLSGKIAFWKVVDV